MDNNNTTELNVPLDGLIGPRAAKRFAEHLNLHTIGHLLNHVPRAYFKRGELTPVSSVPLGEDVTLIARVQSANKRKMQTRKGFLCEVIITDDDGGRLGSLSLTFFNGHNAHRDLVPGAHAMFYGKVTAYKGRLTLTNPGYSLLDEDEMVDPALLEEPIPVYPAAAKVESKEIQKAVGSLLDSLVHSQLNDPVPPEISRRDKLMNVTQAYELIHRPHVLEDTYRAKHRLRYQEALVLQTALARRRALTAQEEATSRPLLPGGLLEQFDSQLSFTLTDGQKTVGETLADELAASRPMHRLLQGEVGSGKTLVALRGMLQVIDSGGQAALLAPTEVLAAQHLQSITRTLGPLAMGGMLGGAADGTKVVLLTGSMSTGQRKQAMLDAATGEAGIVIGTHALLSDNVSFFDLGLIVVDEQHRFGVEQRDVLRSKATNSPHVLVMTATPIPRTVAMTVFGDLDVSTLTELPAGRAPITTHEVGLTENPGWIQRIWARAREEIDAGRQVYVVCPKIGDQEEDSTALELYSPETVSAPRSAQQELTSVSELSETLQELPVLAGVSIGLLHGRLDPAEKTATMARFNDGSVQLLVSTTVIEVGVDVANATMMVIMDADRFGISQLHQLRGRVGRGGHPGTCLLVTQLEPDHPSRERLAAVASTTDGFELSQKDLELRREGNILGASQSGGRSSLHFLRVIQDAKIIERAREDAQQIVADDLDLVDHPELAEALEIYLDPVKEAYLERG
ncbi:ATP-dependent DNA helicase RecG [Arthrobacter sp. HLT1-21]